jgi:hypothetical protein
MKFFPIPIMLPVSARTIISSLTITTGISGISTSNVQRTNNRPKYSGTVLGGAVKVAHHAQ